MSDQAELILTNDGSHSLFSSKYQAAYHSHYGAIDESLTIFLNAGLHYLINTSSANELSIFEMGFGTGLNALLTAMVAEKKQFKVNYTSIELHPVVKADWQSLNYGKLLKRQNIFNSLHELDWTDRYSINPYFDIRKVEGNLMTHIFSSRYDLIYYDAFAPSCQPDLWEEPVHKKLFDSLNPGGCLVTYCAKGSFKRMLTSLGYKLESLPGPGKKKEITRAVK